MSNLKCIVAIECRAPQPQTEGIICINPQESRICKNVSRHLFIVLENMKTAARNEFPQ